MINRLSFFRQLLIGEEAMEKTSIHGIVCCHQVAINAFITELEGPAFLNITYY